MITIEQLETLRGMEVYDADGSKIGAVEEVFVDEQTQEPEWIGLGTGFFGSKRVLVPAQTAKPGDDSVSVPYSKNQVKDAPDIAGDYVDQGTEAALYSHYGLDYSESRSETGLPEGPQAGGTGHKAMDTGLSPDAPDSARDTTAGSPSVVRSEEELRVGKREREAGRVQLHKWVETEQVEVPVNVRREKARITREPADGTTSPEEIGDESMEVTLTEEEPVVQKETVAKERIGIETEVETETQTVGDKVRKERVDVDEEGTRR
jgi:uncharacterized protein (TIGR02271 family)